MRTTSDVPQSPLAAPANPADRWCEGCDHPAHEVGPLMRYRVTLTDGRQFTARYCDDCADLAAVACVVPGVVYGAFVLPDRFVAVERVVERVVTGGVS